MAARMARSHQSYGASLRLQGRPRSNRCRRSRALRGWVALVLCGDLTLGLLVLLVVIGLDDVFDHRPGSFATMFAAFLNQNGDGNFRVATGGVADEPGIIFEFFLFPKFLAGCVTDHLRGARFSAHFDSRQADVSRGATFFVDDAVHTVGYFLHGRFGKREPLFADIRSVLQQVGLFENSATCYSTDHPGKLQRGSRDGALTGGHGDRFTGIPLAMKNALDPFRGRHQPGHFLGEIDSGLVSQAQFTAIVGKSIDAQAHSDVVEEDVTRLEDRFVQAHHTVRALPVNPALELAAVKVGVARAKRREIFRGIFVLQHGRSCHDFENRPRRKLRLDCTIEQRMQGVFVQILPVIPRNTHGEIVGIQGRMAHHRQDFSGARVQGDYRTGARPQGLLRDLLQIVVDGQLNLFAGNGFLSGEAIHFLANAVYDHAAHAVRALKQVVVLALQSGLSREVSGAELAVARFNLLLADFTNVARGMG